MPEALMRYDRDRKRWRAMYKGERLSVKCKDLGGEGYDDTLVAANRWFRKRCEEIDQKKGDEPYRQNEAEYLDELASIQTAINSIKPLLKFDKTLQATIDKLYRKRNKINKLLKSKKLPPLPKEVKNPLHISTESIEEEVEEEAYDELLEKMKTEYEVYSHDPIWLASQEYL